jgi:hypothetical protein
MKWLDRLQDAWHRADIERRIERDGWTAIYVGDDHQASASAYSVGIGQTLGPPEIVVFDATQEVVNALFWQVYSDLRAGELRLEDGARQRRAESRCVWRKVHADQLCGWLPAPSAEAEA